MLLSKVNRRIRGVADAEEQYMPAQLGKCFDRPERPLEALGVGQPSRMSADRQEGEQWVCTPLVRKSPAA
jgi:hypothetical protein